MSSGPESNDIKKDDEGDTVMKKEDEGDLRRREEIDGDGGDEIAIITTPTREVSQHGESNNDIKSEPTEATAATNGKQEEHDDSGGSGNQNTNVEADDNHVVVKADEEKAVDEDTAARKDPPAPDAADSAPTTTPGAPAASTPAPAIAVSQSPAKPDFPPAPPNPATASAPAPVPAPVPASPAVSAATAPHPLAAAAAAAGYPPYHLHHHHHPQNPHYPYAHYYAYPPPPPPGWPVQQQQQQQPPSTTTDTAAPSGSVPTSAGTKFEEGPAGPSGSANDEKTPTASQNTSAESSTAAATADVPGPVSGAGTADAANPSGEPPASIPAPNVETPTATAASAATPHPYYHYYYPPPHQHHYPGFGAPPPQHPGQAPPPPHHPHFPPGYPPHLAGLPLPTAPGTHGDRTDGGQSSGGGAAGAMDSIANAASSSHAASTAVASSGGGDGSGKGSGPLTPGMYGYYNVKKDESKDKSDQRAMDLDNRIGATSPSQIDSFHREEVTTMGCNCKKTKCLKLYCQCFAVKIYCGTNCRCMACRNTPQNENERQDAIRSILSRNPMAFDTKFQKHATAAPDPVVQAQVGPYGQVVEVAHKLGCKCRKSACMKKYCECYAGNVKCSINCRCQGCKNMPPEGLPSLDERLRLSAAQHSRSAAPSVDAVMASFKGHAAATSAATAGVGGGSQPGRSRSNSQSTASSSPTRVPPAVSHVKANSISDAAQNLAFLKHGGSPQPKKPSSSRSEPEKTAVNALLMAAMVMTEQAEMSTPPTTDQSATNAKGSTSTPDSATISPGEKYRTPQRNLMKKFGSPKRKTPDGGSTKSQRSTKVRKDQKSSPSKEISKSKAKRTKRKETKSTVTARGAGTSMEGESDNLPAQGLTPVTARTIEFRGMMLKDSPKGSKPSKKKDRGTK